MRIIALILCAAALGCDDDPKWPSTVNAVRGAYLANTVLGCVGCHLRPLSAGETLEYADLYAGGEAFIIEFGGGTQKFFARNLTSDDETGLGRWSDDEIKRAITKGVSKNGDALFPVMPYFAFANLNDEDLESIVRFLRTLPAKKNQIPLDTFSLTAPFKPIDPAKVPRSTVPSSDVRFASAERGRYLAQVACIVCHTERNAALDPPLELGRAFAGGDVFDFGTVKSTSSNLTPHATGIAGWSVEEVVATVRFAKEKGTGREICPPMPAGAGRAGDMIEQDLVDIATYLTTLAPVENGPFGCTAGGN